jgi:hypothetical protein
MIMGSEEVFLVEDSFVGVDEPDCSGISSTCLFSSICFLYLLGLNTKKSYHDDSPTVFCPVYAQKRLKAAKFYGFVSLKVEKILAQGDTLAKKGGYRRGFDENGVNLTRENRSTYLVNKMS